MDEKKIEWRKEPGFAVRKKPQILTIPEQNYFSIKGTGDPNLPDFSNHIQALYPISYAIRMSQKAGWIIPSFQQYTVYPLEGFWGLQSQFIGAPVMEKSHFKYTLSIKQPDFVTEAIATEAKERAASKVDPTLLEAVFFEHRSAQLVAQILHVGSFDDEPATFKILEDFIEQNHYQRISKEHTEIYVSDFRRVEESKRKTILRVAITPKKIN